MDLFVGQHQWIGSLDLVHLSGPHLVSHALLLEINLSVRVWFVWNRIYLDYDD